MSKQITLDLSSPAIKHLCNRDKRMQKIISMVGSITYTVHTDGYSFLIHEIIEQMLSIKAGEKIYSRLVKLCDGKITPDRIYSLSFDEIKGTGTAAAKVQYIKNLTEKILSKELVLSELDTLSDSAVIEVLTSIRGIGAWTAKMYLIFVLDRPDVLPYEDGAFLQSYKWAYKTNDLSHTAIKKKCHKWHPYSSIAARYMYRALDIGLTKKEFHLFKEENTNGT